MAERKEVVGDLVTTALLVPAIGEEHKALLAAYS
jgi:hypothetical protein